MSPRARRVWRYTGAAAGVCLAILLAILFWPATAIREIGAAQSSAEVVEAGSYLATAADCVACHTAEGGQPYAGGRAFKLPFGTIYAPNITPDRETGIGAWSDGEFLRAMHKGIGRDDEQLYPAFPYTSYFRLSDADVLAIKAYLFTLAPVREAVPANDLAFPFRYRRLVRLWNILFMPEDDREALQGASPQLRRGQYLVNALGHCGECHTPRNVLYGLSDEALSGETLQGWTAWNITADEQHGIGGWSDDELVSYLRTGYAGRRGVASGPMKEAIDHSLSKLTEADLYAIAAYLKVVTGARRGPIMDQSDAASVRSTFVLLADPTHDGDRLGRQIFEGACVSCHAWNGQGRQFDAAALNGRRSVLDVDGTNVVQTILHGGGVGTLGDPAFMPDFKEAYSDSELAAVANFTLLHFGGAQGRVTAERVERARAP